MHAVVWAAIATAWVTNASATRGLDLSAARASITATDAKRHVHALADDTFEGREAGSRGGRAAGGYIAESLSRHGTQPAGGEGYFQPFGTMRNILAILPGSDPSLAREIVVASAHYDHVGYGTPTNSFGPTGLIHNGADDNASGVAGLLEIVEACGHLPVRPRRSILFAFWDGEEKGLLGSSHFLRSRPRPVEGRPLVINVNLDMIGRLRNRRVELFGCRTAGGMRARLARANLATGLELAFDWKVAEDSDHYAFIMAGIPAIMFHTGLHEQYHRPSDDAHLVDHEGMEPVVRLVFDTIAALADDPAPLPAFRPAGRTETDSMRRGLEMPAAAGARGRWGIGMRSDPCEPQAPIVVRVAVGTPAQRAGIAVGDRIMAIDAVPIADQDDLAGRLGAIVAPGQVSLDVERGGRLARVELKE
jgi:hypothetical protein